MDTFISRSKYIFFSSRDPNPHYSSNATIPPFLPSLSAYDISYLIEKTEVTRQKVIFSMFAIFHPAMMEIICLPVSKVLCLLPKDCFFHYPFSFVHHFFLLCWISTISIQTHSTIPNFLKLKLSRSCITLYSSNIFVLRAVSVLSSLSHLPFSSQPAPNWLPNPSPHWNRYCHCCHWSWFMKSYHYCLIIIWPYISVAF